MAKYDFYYDESEHSRKINLKTVSADNYYDCLYDRGRDRKDISIAKHSKVNRLIIGNSYLPSYRSHCEAVKQHIHLDSM